MKKVFIIVAMTLTSAATQASENAVNTDAFDMSTNMNSLKKYLNLSDKQVQDVATTHDAFCSEMKEAGTATNDIREKKMDLAVKRDLKYMKMYLDRDQYKKYLRVLNATFVNKNLK